MSLTGATSSSDKFLFRGLSKTRDGYRLRASGGLSYSRVRELVLEKLIALGLDKRKFGLHSLRSGGASAAAQAGVPDRLLVDGAVRQLRMGTSKISWMIG